MLSRKSPSIFKAAIVKKLCKRTKGLLKIFPHQISLIKPTLARDGLVSSIEISLDSILYNYLVFCCHNVPSTLYDSVFTLLDKEAKAFVGEPIIPPKFFFVRRSRIQKFSKLLDLSQQAIYDFSLHKKKLERGKRRKILRVEKTNSKIKVRWVKIVKKKTKKKSHNTKKALQKKK